MRKEKIFSVDNETFVFNSLTNIVTTNLNRVVPTIVFLNKIQSFVNRFDFDINVFGSGCEEYGITYECKVRQGFNTIIYEAIETPNRTDGILDCYEWLLNNQKLEI